MFDLVADVERYPDFLPLVEGLRVLGREESTEGLPVVLAEMRVGYKAISEAFTTRVTLDRPHLRILVEHVDGPFRHLENRWTFAEAQRGGCNVGFSIAYEFKSRALGLVVGRVFDRAFRAFTDAFETRADRVYGA